MANINIVSSDLDILAKVNDLMPKVKEILTPVKGHKIYHLEGDAWEHTLLVMGCAQSPLEKLCYLLHDIGKAECHVEDKEGWCTYPNHARGGAEILHEFIEREEDPTLFDTLHWVIGNHIKTLFLYGNRSEPDKLRKDITKLLKSIPEGVDKSLAMSLLLRLGVADIRGSVCSPDVLEEQTRTVGFLTHLEWERVNGQIPDSVWEEFSCRELL